jgi:hypothetical protein
MSHVRWIATPCLLTVGLLAGPAFGMEPGDGPPGLLPFRVMVGLDVGVVRMNESGPFGFGNGVGSVTEPGPSWGLRAGVEPLPWLAFEARYVGAYAGLQSSVSPAGTLGFLTTAGEIVARFTAPLPYVHPYVLGGVGYYDVALAGGSGAKAASPMFSSSQPGIPLGVGFDVPLIWHLSPRVEVDEASWNVYTSQHADTSYSSVIGRRWPGSPLCTELAGHPPYAGLTDRECLLTRVHRVVSAHEWMRVLHRGPEHQLRRALGT